MSRWYSVTFRLKNGRTITVETSANTENSAKRYGRWKLDEQDRMSALAIKAVLREPSRS